MAVIVSADIGLVVQDAGSGFCGAVTGCGKDSVTLRDRQGRERVFPLLAGAFLLEGEHLTGAAREVAIGSSITLVRPAASTAAPRRTASGSIAVPGQPARVAKASRIFVEGVHDAALVERIWGDDLRIEGIVVEPLHGIDDLPSVVRDFSPSSSRRLGVLVDHLVPGSKESRIVDSVTNPHVLVTGHPYVDIWQAVRPGALGIAAWPTVPRGVAWKDGVCQALGAGEPADMWRRSRRTAIWRLRCWVPSNDSSTGSPNRRHSRRPASNGPAGQTIAAGIAAASGWIGACPCG